MRCEASLLKDPFSEMAEQMTTKKQDLNDIPHVFCCVTELTTSNACRQAVVADGNLIVLEVVRKVIFALGHCTDEDAYALVGAERLDVVLHSYDRSLEGQGHFPAVGGQMLGDGVLDDPKELLLRRCGSD